MRLMVKSDGQPFQDAKFSNRVDFGRCLTWHIASMIVPACELYLIVQKKRRQFFTLAPPYHHTNV